MIFLDINTFYSPKGGGIRTYHRAKLNFFKNDDAHEYHLVCPGPCRRSTKLASNVFLEEFYSLPLGRDPKGYRLMLDYFSVFFLIRRLKPDVVEAGDPWLTGFFCLFTPFPRGTLRSSFYHSDPVDTYFAPWAAVQGPFRLIRKGLVKAGEKVFYFLQRRYFTTIVASKAMQCKLNSKTIPRISCLPFGVNPVFIETGKKRNIPGGQEQKEKVKLLYAGRLDNEKGIDLLLRALPEFTGNGGMTLTVAGRGKYESVFRQMNNPSVFYAGYISDYQKLAELYLEHDIFLSTGGYETFGLAVLEALAAGMVVVGPDQGGSAEILGDAKSEFIFRTGEKVSFCEKIRQASACDFSREIPRSLSTAQAYGDWENSIGRMVEYYSQFKN